MFVFEILTQEKTKETWLQKALEDYEKRLKGKILFSWQFFKKEELLLLKAKNSPFVIALDPCGALFSTEELASWLQNSLEKSKGTLTFVIGGPKGLPKALQKNFSLSLSPLTLTHQMVRLLFTEQIYRCFTIWNHHPYHK